MGLLRLGAAGWKTFRAIKKSEVQSDPELKSYSEYFNCVEVSSTFFRVPSSATFAIWAALTPADFRFAIRIPEAVSHVDASFLERRSRLRTFLGSIRPLGERLGLLIFTLPVDEAFSRSSIDLLGMVKDECGDLLVCQARHPTWLSVEADHELEALGIPMASLVGGASAGVRSPVGDRRRQYWRLHHAPGADHGKSVYQNIEPHLDGAEEIWIICDHCRQAESLAATLPMTTAGLVQLQATPAGWPQPSERSSILTAVQTPEPADRQIFHLYFLNKEDVISHILAVEFSSCEEVFEWIGRHKYAHDIEVWKQSELIALCPRALCAHRSSSLPLPEKAETTCKLA